MLPLTSKVSTTATPIPGSLVVWSPVSSISAPASVAEKASGGNPVMGCPDPSTTVIVVTTVGQASVLVEVI
jgi:hypothetical protein